MNFATASSIFAKRAGVRVGADVRAPAVVALEPQVLAALNEYARQIARGEASGV